MNSNQFLRHLIFHSVSDVVHFVLIASGEMIMAKDYEIMGLISLMIAQHDA